ncbi:MAG: hypothetical protein NTV30_00100, partial [Chloroflexi bacterium]|nr:hypothetical protein [Chloroflexota bacterium]
MPVFTGCNDKCLAQGECQSDICTKKLSAGPSEEERKECADAGGAIAVGGDGSRCVCKCRDENVPCTPGTIPCCQGLTPIQLSMEQNGQCITASCGSICKPCGNGVCDSGENKCNCPVDCGKSQECNRRSDCCCKGVGGG